MKKLFTIICMLLPVALWAQEPYAVLSEDNTVLTFYYDENKSSYTNTMGVGPFNTYTARGWHSVRADIHMVVFDSSFSAYSPTSTALWFWGLQSMTIISGIENLHTDEVTDMNGMFNYCYALESLDLSTFNTGKVTNIAGMFYGCNKLKTIYVADGWSTDKIITTTISGTGGNGGWQTFAQCSSLVGGKGTTFNAGHTDYTYAHIDGGANNPGYFTDKNASVVNDSIEVVGNTDLSSEWWTAFSSNYEIPANYTLHMRFVNHSAKANSWENWVMLCTADSTRMPEYFALRADRYGWGDYYDANGFSVNWADQDAFREAMDGATVDFTVRRWGSEVVVTSVSTATDGSEYIQTYTTAIDTAANRSVNVFLTVEKAYLEIYKNSITLTPSEAPAEPEPYAVLSDDNTVLTFYYDNQKEARGGMSVGPFGSDEYRGWSDSRETITRVVFDESFANVSTINSTDYWFYGMKNLTIIEGLPYLNTSNVTSMRDMFSQCASLTSLDVSNFNTSKVTNMHGLFAYCSSLTSLDLTNFNTENVTDMGYMFPFCSSLTSLDVSSFNTANVTNMFDMFGGCSSLTTLDVTNFNTERVTNMEYMFYNCHSLTSLDVSNFNTASVTNMAHMFAACNLTVLDLSSFNTSSVTDMSQMFFSSYELTTIYAGNDWTTEAVTDGTYMFSNCSLLVGGQGTSYSDDHTDHTYAHIDGGESNPGYFTDKNAPVPAEKPSAPEFAFEGDNLVVTTQTEGASIFYAMADLPSTGDEAVVDSVTNSFTVKVGASDGNFYYEQPFELKKSVVLKAIAVGNGTDGKEAVSDTTVLVYDYEAWLNLLKAAERGNQLMLISLDNTKVDQTLVEELKWMLEESTMIYNYRANMPYFEAKHFAMRINEICDQIEAQLSQGGTPEPYAVLSDNNTVLTFYYDDQKEIRGGMSVGPFDIPQSRGWYEAKDYITSVVFDDSFADCTTITSTRYWFDQCFNLASISGLQFLNTSNVTDMDGMFWECSSLGALDLSNFKTSNVTSMNEMFASCKSLTTLDVSNFDTSNVKYMNGMFTNCSGLTTLDLSNFVTSNVLVMPGMFADCSSLTKVDLSSFNTANVWNMESMFYRCSALATIYVGADWTTAAVTQSSNNMFSGCFNLVGGAGTVYDANHTDHTYAHIDGGAANPGYFTDKNAPVSSDDLEIYAVEHNSTIVPNETIAATPSIRLTPGNDTQWNTEYSIAIDNDSEDLTIDFTASIYYPDYTTTYEFLGSMYGTNNPKDSLLADGVSGGTGYKYYLRNLPLSGGYIVFEALQDGSLIVPVHINPKKQFYVVDANGKVKTDIQLKDASGQTLPMLSSPLCAVSDEKSVTAFASFNVKQGESYYMFCTGSKMRFGGYVFSKLSIDIDPVTMAAVKDELESSPVEYDGLVLRVGSDVSMENALRAVGGISAVSSNIAAIVWNSSTPIDNSELQELTNPNMLIYVKADSLAPQNRDNVIVGDVAKNIVLTDVAEGNGSFYCPQGFKAEMISYTRNFSQQTEVGVARGWETIALPFTVQTITHEKQGVIAPFNNTASNKHFWLRQVAESENDGGLTGAAAIEAYTPYLISMPNSEAYPADYCLNERVTFSAQNAQVGKTELYPKEIRTADGAMIMMVPCFQGQTATQDVYALNVGVGLQEYPEGSVFVRASRDVRPFEAFTVHHGGNAPQYIAIQDLSGGAMTGIESLTPNPSPKGEGSNYYSLDGRKLQQKPNRKGVYIRNGKKMVVR